MVLKETTSFLYGIFEKNEVNYMKKKIAILGLNWGNAIIRDHFLNGTAKDFFDLAAVCDMDKEKTDRIALEYGVCAYYDLDTLLEDKSIDAVGLFAGPNGRADLISKIIRAGKDVITTKPFEQSSAKARAVFEEAKALNRVIHLNSPSPEPAEDIRVILEWIEKYDLGRPIACRADVWANYREKADGSWYDNPSLCPVPPIYRLGIYLLNDIARIFGEPERVMVMQSRIFTERPTSDNAQISILFKNNALANIFASFCVNDGMPYRNSLVLNFEKGTIYRNYGPMNKTENTKLGLIADDGSVMEKYDTSVSRSSHYQWENFYKAMNGEKIETDIDTVLSALKVIELMKEAQYL